MDAGTSGSPRRSWSRGRAPAAPPSDETFWARSVAGAGTQTLDANLKDGDWRVVVMNNDAARNVLSEISVGAELEAMFWVGIALLVAGGLLAAGADTGKTHHQASVILRAGDGDG
ncbi:MAG: hypothetical protein M3282_02985 [Gemmatimonadota bacterium]|nr:hypothetical protein [Gemmatimonadota bacterium]